MKNVSDSLVCLIELVGNTSYGGDVTHTAIETAMNKFVKKEETRLVFGGLSL